jgi:hypothetical protein
MDEDLKRLLITIVAVVLGCIVFFGGIMIWALSV